MPTVKQKIIPFLLLLSVFCLSPAQADERVIRSEANYAFGQVMRFQLTMDNASDIKEAMLFFQVPEFDTTYTATVPVTIANTLTLTHEVDLTLVRLAPFTTVTYWWLLHNEANENIQTPAQTFVYADDQFAWRSLTQQNVTVYWAGEDANLGQIGIDIVMETLPRLQILSSVVSELPLQIYIYPTSADLRAALRLTGRDWVGAHASPELGVILVTAVNIRTAATDLRQSIPHELTHFFLYEATTGGYEGVPYWFNEGIATYMEATSNPRYATLLETAVAQQATIPLANLCQTFPTSEEQALLAYAQSVSFIQFLQARYGNQILSQLIAVFADGADCQSGVRRTLNLSLDELNQQWLRSLQPRTPFHQFWLDNGLWLLLLLGSFGVTCLFLIKPYGAYQTSL